MDGTTMILGRRLPQHAHVLEDNLATTRRFAALINANQESHPSSSP